MLEGGISKNKRYICMILLIIISIVNFGCGLSQSNLSDNDEKGMDNVPEITTIQEPDVINDLKKLHEQQKLEHNNDKENDDTGDDSEESKKLKEFLDSMTLKEKVAQMFIVFPESLVEGVPCVSMAGDVTKEAIYDIPVGGIVYLSQNLKSPEQVKSMLYNTQQYSEDRIGIPIFLCVDEEGGKIARIANNYSFKQQNVGDMAKLGVLNDTDQAYMIGNTIGNYLHDLGFNLDFAPVADVSGLKWNSVIGNRAFSSDPEIVSNMALAVSKGLEDNGVVSVFKHFPGHGSTQGDPHKGYAYTDKSLSELEKCDLIPFERGIEEDVSMIMVGHISLPQILNDDTPASLSKEMIQKLLREDMKYDGIIITDAMNMGAISDVYESDEAACKAVEAGADIILMPKDFKCAYDGLLNAINNREISEERINESVMRILKVKMKLRGYND